MYSLSRRDALKLAGLAVTSAAASPIYLPVSQEELFQRGSTGRVCSDFIYVYKEPEFSSERLSRRTRDQLISLLEEVFPETGPAYNPRWYRIPGGYVHSAYIQVVKQLPSNPPLGSIPKSGLLGVVTVPYTRAQRYSRLGGWQPLYRLYFGSLHWVTGRDEGPDGLPWYRLRDHYVGVDYHAAAADLRPIEPREYQPISTDVDPEEKVIHVSIADQYLTAYEGSKAVLECPVSTGRPSPADLPEGEIPSDTPTGNFRIQTKMPSRHMGDGRLTNDIYAYELPGVPWTMVFTDTGVAFHGTYWHDNFGRRMSSGCVNMRNQDALWLFRWANPVYEMNNYYKRESGTRVLVS
jgi:lipoprotein-anchoring transpeptidase ErfK/SrfK